MLFRLKGFFWIFWTLIEGEETSTLLSNSYVQEAEDFYCRVSTPVSCSGGSEIQHCSKHTVRTEAFRDSAHHLQKHGEEVTLKEKYERTATF
jgi:hypothetical protein